MAEGDWTPEDIEKFLRFCGSDFALTGDGETDSETRAAAKGITNLPEAQTTSVAQILADYVNEQHRDGIREVAISPYLLSSARRIAQNSGNKKP